MRRRGIALAGVLALLFAVLSVPVAAHSGRTDSSGGHKDNKNKSGLGSYHYHCGGYPAHLHDGGVCPYTDGGYDEEEEPASPPEHPNSVNVHCEHNEIVIGKYAEASADVSEAVNSTVTWSSEDDSVATVDQNGRVYGVGPGTVHITATASGGAADSFTITIKEIPVADILLDKEFLSAEPGGVVSLKINVVPEDASNKEIKWAVDDSSVASVDSTGRITAINPGKTVITAASANGINKTCIVEVFLKVSDIQAPGLPASITVGENVALKAKVLPENATDTSVTFKSSDETVAEVDKLGRITAKAKGKVKIMLINKDLTKEFELNILPVLVSRIDIGETEAKIAQGGKMELKAAVYPENAEDKSVIWRVDNEELARIEDGRLIAEKPGKVVVTAVSSNGIQDSFELEIEGNPVGIVVTLVILAGGAGVYLFIRKKKSNAG